MATAPTTTVAHGMTATVHEIPNANTSAVPASQRLTRRTSPNTIASPIGTTRDAVLEADFGMVPAYRNTQAGAALIARPVGTPRDARSIRPRSRSRSRGRRLFDDHLGQVGDRDDRTMGRGVRCCRIERTRSPLGCCFPDLSVSLVRRSSRHYYHDRQQR